MLILKTWLQYLTDLDFFGLFMKIIRSIFLALDGIIYAIISYCYEVFTFISEIRVFENEDMVNLANRIYILIGVVSLFLVAYTLLNAIINPENATKDKNKSFAGIVKNIILAIIGIAIVPTIFDYAYEFQSRVLCNNVIQKFFLENNITEDDDARAKMGAQMSLYLFKSFYYIKGSEDDTSLDENANSNWETMAQSIVSDSDDSYNLSMAFSDIELGNRSISEALGDFDDSIDSGKLGYLFLISTLAGAYCAYVLLNFVIDMGVRAVKLAYLQLIAPLPILTIILPNQKKVFDNWLKKTSSCFIEVFTRIIAMSFAFYAIKYLRPWIFNDMSSVSCGRTVGAVTKLLAEAAFIIGVFTFLKQLPKFLKDLLPGFDSSGFKLGIADKLGEMALIGGAAKSGFQRAEGAATGAAGGLATGLANRKKVDWKSAVMQGATQGFKDKGNQFLKQRKSTFQKIAGNTDKDQGLFGGESKISKFINDHKNDVKNSSGEIANSKKYNGQNDVHYQDLKNNFTDDKVDKRMEDFKQSDIYKQAENYAQERMKALGTTSKEVHDRELANYLTNAKSYTTDENLKRKITQFENDAEVSSNRKNYYEAKDDYNKSLSDLNQAKLNLTDTRKKLNSKAKEITLKESEIKTENTNLENLDTTLSSSKNELDTSKLELDNAKLKLDNASAKKQQLTVDLNNQEINLRNAAKEMFNIVGNRVNLHKPDLEKCSVQELNDYINDCSLEIQNDPMTQETIDKINLINNSQTDYQTLKKEYDDSENEYNSAQSDYSSKTSNYNSKESDYQTVYNQVEQQKKKVENLVNENKALHSQEEQLKSDEQKYQSLAQRLHHENENAKNNLSKQETIYVDSVDKGTEAIYNGDASIHYNGSDDLKTFDNEIINAIKNKDIDLAKELIRQKKTQEEYRGAKKGITDMSKPIDYEKELYNYFKKQKKDE